MTVLYSKIDQSVNWTKPHENGFVESRFVRRVDDYFIVYLSSQVGCDQACRFCHLTQTRQTGSDQVDLEGFKEQALQVMEYYDKQPSAKKVHFNFMARGEPLLNPEVREMGDLYDFLKSLADVRGLEFKIKVSSILPKSISYDFFKSWEGKSVELYYSLYSLDPNFRKRWIPKGLSPDQALIVLKDLSNRIVLHQAYLHQENDRFSDLFEMRDWIFALGRSVDFNIVRYNPHSESVGKESLNFMLERICEFWKTSECIQRFKIVPRVGKDVFASCGMFVNAS